MTKAELLELVANGENSGVEFKRDDLRPEQLAKEAVAFANFEGGRVLLGVEDDGAVSGVQRGDLERWVMDTVFGRYVHPFVLPYYEEVVVGEGRRVAVVTIGRGVHKPYVVRASGREDIYVRVGSTSRLATREQQAQLFATGGLMRPELLPVSGSGLEDLSLERARDYWTAFAGNKSPPDTEESWCARLAALGFMSEDSGAGAPACTVAGLLLFGYSPRRLLPSAGVRWMCFAGEDKEYDALDDQVIDGPLVGLWKTLSTGREMVEKGLVDRLADAMRPFVSEESAEADDSFRREVHWHYPRDAVREAVANAVAHCDRTRLAQIEVALYADRLEITSPGALPNGMTVAKMIAGQRVPRNLLVSEVLRDYGYADARGMGVRRKVIPLLRESNGVDPEFEATEDYVKVTLRRGPA